jgi:hypothetical protein
MPSRARTNREALFGEPETRGVAMTETLDFTALDQFLGIKRLAANTAPASPLGSPVAWRRPKPTRRQVPDRQRGERQSHGQNGDGTQ